MPIRRGSRSGEIPFEWNDPTTWEPALAGVQAGMLEGSRSQVSQKEVVEGS